MKNQQQSCYNSVPFFKQKNRKEKTFLVIVCMCVFFFVFFLIFEFDNLSDLTEAGLPSAKYSIFWCRNDSTLEFLMI